MDDSVANDRPLPARLLSTLGEINDEEWPVPAELTGLGEFLYATVDDPAGHRSIHYGTVAAPFTLTIDITEESTPPVGTDIEVDGVEWSETDEPDGWSAERMVGNALVRVASSDIDKEAGRRVLAQLTVVSTDDLPFEPLDSWILQQPGRDGVANYSSDGLTLTMHAVEQNNYHCTSYTNGAVGGGACGNHFDPAINLASAVSPGMNHEVGSTTVEAYANGIVAPDIVLIEVDFINDVTVTVEPTDLTGTFDSRFWIAGARIELEDDQQPDTIFSSVLQVRGLDADGQIVFTQPAGAGTVDR